MTPDTRCVIEASCVVHPSEDPDKVAAAVSNVLAGTEAGARGPVLAARSRSLASLEGLREAIRARRQQGAYRRSLERNLEGSTTTFYLNKQAAFAGRMAICREPDESPLGPITVTISSPDIRGVLDWLVS